MTRVMRWLSRLWTPRPQPRWQWRHACGAVTPTTAAAPMPRACVVCGSAHFAFQKEPLGTTQHSHTRGIPMRTNNDTSWLRSAAINDDPTAFAPGDLAWWRCASCGTANTQKVKSVTGRRDRLSGTVVNAKPDNLRCGHCETQGFADDYRKVMTPNPEPAA